ncbi:hypothetical protein FGU65_14180 [Methanoculleus sp. FWC-SCC1]|uniref:Tubulin like n=1 Tax=Methanoculleus frigidifontis TaxID=2584085 RepID=A0ABT8MDJ8_9EURY|nr:tubulin-like doman-containing protein [Methanoculleus sp. FWC-SCC1]MDN7026017.1 hypothetical protein [Methanoculleus sp. FWC-SCC1]
MDPDALSQEKAPFQTGRTAFQMPSDLTIVAIGGCGKKLVYNLCQHDWFLKDYLHEDRTLKICVLDTDSNQRNSDIETTKSVNKKVENMMREISGLSGSVKMEYYYLPDLASVGRVSSLTGSTVVDQVKNWRGQPHADFWWMNDPDNGFDFDNLRQIDNNIIDDFGGGVHRRRAISKAVFYKAVSQSGDTNFPSFSGQGDVAIVVGLGGGTGSGMFIDLARYIKGISGQTRKIWLLGVLPAIAEGDKEQLNAGIALSEVEYLNLTGEKLFNYCILSSLGPTGFRDGADRKQEVVEYDLAFPYLLINAFYLPTADFYDIIDARRDYSGFIFADAHVIEYPVEELRDLKGEFEKVIAELAELGRNREEIVKKVEDLLNGLQQKYPDQLMLETDIITTGEDISYVKAEIQNLEKIWSNEIPKLLKYQTPLEIDLHLNNNLPEDIRNLEEIRTYDKLIEFVSRLKRSMDVGNKPLENEDDKILYGSITKSLEQIEHLAILQKRILRIKDHELRVILKKILRGEEDLAHVLSQLISKRASFKNEDAALEERKQQTADKLSQFSQQQDDAQASIQSALGNARREISAYETQRANLKHFQIKEQELADEFQQMHQRLKELVAESLPRNRRGLSRDAWYVESGYTKMQASIDLISRDLQQPDRLEYLKELAEALARYYFYEYRKQSAASAGSFLDKARGLIYGHAPDMDALEANLNAMLNRMKTIAEQKSAAIVFLEPLNIELLDGFITRDLEVDLDQTKTEITNSIVSALKFEELDYAEYEKLMLAFDCSGVQEIASAISDTLVEIVNSEGKYDENISESRREIEQIDHGRSEIAHRIEAFNLIDNLVEETLKYRRLFNRHNNGLTESLATIEKKRQNGDNTVRGKYRTRYGGINPNVLSLISSQADMGALDIKEEGQDELERVLGLVKSNYRKLIDTGLLGIKSSAISYGKSQTEAWTFERAALVVSSPSQYATESIHNVNEDICRTISRELALDQPHHTKVVAHNYGKPWEIGLTFFAAASFFENISPLMTGGGYWAKYEKNKNNILHHVLLLNEGKYVVRKDLLTLAVAAEFADSEKKEDDSVRGRAKSNVLSLYEEKNIKDALRSGTV